MPTGRLTPAQSARRHANRPTLDERVTVRLPPAQLAAVDAEVAEGKYANRSELIRELVRKWSNLRELGTS